MHRSLKDMAKYKRRPDLIDAEQFFPGMTAVNKRLGIEENKLPSGDTIANLNTSDAIWKLEAGDFVVTYSNGKKIVMKPDAFHKAFEIHR